MIKYLCDVCKKELRIMFVGKMEPNQYSIILKDADGGLIVAKIESMNKPPNKMDNETKELYSDPVNHVCSECLSEKVSESEIAVLIP